MSQILISGQEDLQSETDLVTARPRQRETPWIDFGDMPGAVSRGVQRGFGQMMDFLEDRSDEQTIDRWENQMQRMARGEDANPWWRGGRAMDPITGTMGRGSRYDWASGEFERQMPFELDNWQNRTERRAALARLAPRQNDAYSSQILNMVSNVITLAAAGGPSRFLQAATIGGVSTEDARRRLIEQGVDADDAMVGGLIEGGFMAAGVYIPASLGFRSMLLRGATGAAINVGVGGLMRGGMNAYLNSAGYPEVAEHYKWFDGVAIAIDAILGGTFGAMHPARGRNAGDPEGSGQSRRPPPDATPEEWLAAAHALAGQGRFEDAYAHAEIARARGSKAADDLIADLEQRVGGAVAEQGRALARELQSGVYRPSPVLTAAALARLDAIHRDILSAPGFPATPQAQRVHNTLAREAERQAEMDEAIGVQAIFEQAIAMREPDRGPQTLVQFIIQNGGLRDERGEVSHAMGGKTGRETRLVGLINSKGQPLDDAALAAWEAGYFPEFAERPSINDLIAALREEAAGAPRYSADDSAAAYDVEDRAAYEREFDEMGIDPFAPDDVLREQIRQAYAPGRFIPWPEPTAEAEAVLRDVVREAGGDEAMQAWDDALQRAREAQAPIDDADTMFAKAPDLRAAVEAAGDGWAPVTLYRAGPTRPGRNFLSPEPSIARVYGDDVQAYEVKGPIYDATDSLVFYQEDFTAITAEAKAAGATGVLIRAVDRGRFGEQQQIVMFGTGAMRKASADVLFARDGQNKQTRQARTVNDLTSEQRTMLEQMPDDPAQWREAQKLHPWLTSASRAQMVIMANARRANGLFRYSDAEIVAKTKVASPEALRVHLSRARSEGVAILSRNVPKAVQMRRARQSVEQIADELGADPLAIERLLRKWERDNGEDLDAPAPRTGHEEAINRKMRDLINAGIDDNDLLLSKLNAWLAQPSRRHPTGRQPITRKNMLLMRAGLGLAKGKPRPPITPQEVALIWHWNDQGLLQREIAAKIGRTQEVVSKWLRRPRPPLDDVKYAADRRWLAAARDPETGEIYTGPNHFEALETAPEAAWDRIAGDEANSGWLGTGNRWLTREQAIAEMSATLETLHAKGWDKVEAEVPVHRAAANFTTPRGARRFHTTETLYDEASTFFGDNVDAMLDAGRLSIVQDKREIPIEGFAGLPPGVKAVYVRSLDKTFLLAGNILPGQVKGLILHEIGVHAGMRKLLGEGRFEQLLRQVDRLVDSGNEDAVAAREHAEKHSAHPDHVREETLAWLVTWYPDAPAVVSLLAKIRRWIFRTLGTTFGAKLTVEDLQSFATAALRAEAERARRAGPSKVEAVNIPPWYARDDGEPPEPANSNNDLQTQKGQTQEMLQDIAPIISGMFEQMSVLRRGKAPSAEGRAAERWGTRDVADIDAIIAEALRMKELDAHDVPGATRLIAERLGDEAALQYLNRFDESDLYRNIKSGSLYLDHPLAYGWNPKAQEMRQFILDWSRVKRPGWEEAQALAAKTGRTSVLETEYDMQLAWREEFHRRLAGAPEPAPLRNESDGQAALREDPEIEIPNDAGEPTLAGMAAAKAKDDLQYAKDLEPGIEAAARCASRHDGATPPSGGGGGGRRGARDYRDGGQRTPVARMNEMVAGNLLGLAVGGVGTTFAVASDTIERGRAQRRREFEQLEFERIVSEQRQAEQEERAERYRQTTAAVEQGDPMLAPEIAMDEPDADAYGLPQQIVPEAERGPLLDLASRISGADKDYLSRVIDHEARWDALNTPWDPERQQNLSSARGLGQFLDATWDEMQPYFPAHAGLDQQQWRALRDDPRMAATAAGMFAVQNARGLRDATGRDPTQAEVYLAHFLGLSDALRLMRARDVGAANAAAIVPDAAANHRALFYTPQGEPRSAADVIAIQSADFLGANGRSPRFRLPPQQ